MVKVQSGLIPEYALLRNTQHLCIKTNRQTLTTETTWIIRSGFPFAMQFFHWKTVTELSLHANVASPCHGRWRLEGGRSWAGKNPNEIYMLSANPRSCSHSTRNSCKVSRSVSEKGCFDANQADGRWTWLHRAAWALRMTRMIIQPHATA